MTANKGTFGVSSSCKMEFIDITASVQEGISRSGAKEGICVVYNPHTTAGLTINEGADPMVQVDIISALKLMVPMRLAYKHMEGNSPSHIMATLAGSSVTLAVDSGSLQLGTWQKIFFCEFDGPRSRKVQWRMIPG